MTVLTSLNDQIWRKSALWKTADELALHLAKMAREAGASGVVASPRDILSLRRTLGEDFLIVTPGIRASDEKVADDQKERSALLKRFSAGADYIVVGRPIRQAQDPLEACRRIIREIADGPKPETAHDPHSTHGRRSMEAVYGINPIKVLLPGTRPL